MELVLKECSFDAPTLGCILAATRALKSFRYENYRQDDFNLTGTVKVLRDYCKNTLETVSIRAHDSVEILSVDFFEFRQLKMLEIDFKLGLPGNTKLAEILPTSIECVYIQRCMILGQDYVSRLVKDLLAVRAVHVPKLRQLSFVEVRRENFTGVKRISKLVKKAQKAKVILTFEYQA
ncbi:hypothetical protein MMC28_003954 [Mycoblastus sanguinarius]|nr:hypothetical protein [Mycoblastus sanguinarius]